jgi:hypothetical protein
VTVAANEGKRMLWALFGEARQVTCCSHGVGVGGIFLILKQYGHV